MSLLKKISKMFGGEKESAPPARPEPTPEEREATYIAAVEAERTQKESFFKLSPYSPIEPESRLNFPGLKHYPVNPALRFTLPLDTVEREEIIIQTNTGDEQPFYRLGTVTFEIDGQSATLAVYQGVENAELFIPFKDATNGTETYGAGRYLEPTALSGGQIVVDFNLAYNPYCAYSENYVCPLPPMENWLKVPIRAGEMAFKASPQTDPE